MLGVQPGRSLAFRSLAPESSVSAAEDDVIVSMPTAHNAINAYVKTADRGTEHVVPEVQRTSSG